MNIDQVRSVLTVIYTNYDRAVPDGMADIWAATLADVPHDHAHEATLELIKTHVHPPRVAEIREMAKRIERDDERRQAVLTAGRRPITPAGQPVAPPVRNGADLVRYVLAALKAAGQDPAAGKFLGKKRAGDIAELAAQEWLAANKGTPGAKGPTLPRWELSCSHGQPGGREPIKASGKPRCPLCRQEDSLIHSAP